MRCPLLLGACVAACTSPVAHAPITGCIPPDNDRGCACDWEKDATNSATFAGLSHPGSWSPAEIAASGLPVHVVKAADSTPQACELVCCEALLITDAPAAAQAPAQTAACDIWQHGGGTGAAGCWLGIDNTKRRPPLPIVDQGTGRWTGGTGRRSKGSTWGWGFLTAILLFVGAYVGGGLAMGVRKTGHAHGLRAHPHYARWLQTYGMVIDGVRLTRSVIHGGDGGATSAASQGNTSQVDGKMASSSKSERKKRKAGKSKGDHSAKTKGTANKDIARFNKHTTDEPGVASPTPRGNLGESLVASTAPATNQSVSTAAGGGGRWVHVPS
eukprot:SAG22_NODE_869_length_6749_cov_3.048120_9_plen_328_part_00